ncbi:hypothetical protein ACFFGH_10650 [Lysobacter korlensis]|uniref:Uncharacterized protein n=1 Tax=Lysobacter korlensis TaxID=553636 RepID=A0ABV6RMT6_9GAMM
MTPKRTAILGVALLLLAVLAMAGGQLTIWAEMDAVDAAGPGGSGGSIFSAGGLTVQAGFGMFLAGVVLVAVGWARRNGVSKP